MFSGEFKAKNFFFLCVYCALLTEFSCKFKLVEKSSLTKISGK